MRRAADRIAEIGYLTNNDTTELSTYDQLKGISPRRQAGHQRARNRIATTNIEQSPAATMITAFHALLAAASGVALITLTACGDSASPASPRAESSAENSVEESTPTEWPQAADGVIDSEMCGILTVEDFGAYDIPATTDVSVVDFTVDSQKVGVTCNYALDDTLSLGLFPTEDEAARYFALAARRGEVTVTDPVAAADESQFGQDVVPETHTLIVRRGRLYLSIGFNSVMDPLPHDEAHEASVGLAGLVLERAPQLGD